MVKVKVLRYDVKTGKSKTTTEDITLPTDIAAGLKGVDLSEIAKLLEYAKAQGWI